MLATSNADHSSEESASLVQVQLIDWPVRNDGYSAWLTIVATVLIGAICGAAAANALAGLLACAALNLAMWRLWIPVQFDIGPGGVVQTVFGRRRRISWSAIASVRVRRHGVLLLPATGSAPLATLGGLFIRWCGEREALSQVIKRCAARRGAEELATTHSENR